MGVIFSGKKAIFAIFVQTFFITDEKSLNKHGWNKFYTWSHFQNYIFFVHWYSPSFPQDLGPSGYFQSCSKKVVWIFNYPTGMAKSHTFPYFFCGTLPLGWSINMFCVSVISGVNWVQTSSLQSHRIFRAFASLFNLEHIQKDSPPHSPDIF